MFDAHLKCSMMRMLLSIFDALNASKFENLEIGCHTILIIGKRFRAADFLAKFGQTIANVHSVLDALNR